MEKITSRSFLFLELLSYLTYKDIIEIRKVSKQYKIKIDNLSTWEYLISRDYPSIFFIEHVPSCYSLQILRSLHNKQPLTGTTFYVGVIGSLGRLGVDINESYNLSKLGFLGSMKNFVSKNGIYTICLMSIPIVDVLNCHSKMISIFLLLSDCKNDWEKRLKTAINKCEELCIKKLLIVANSCERNNLLEEVSNKYKVILANTLSRENIRRCIFTLAEILLNPAP